MALPACGPQQVCRWGAGGTQPAKAVLNGGGGRRSRLRRRLAGEGLGARPQPPAAGACREAAGNQPPPATPETMKHGLSWLGSPPAANLLGGWQRHGSQRQRLKLPPALGQRTERTPPPLTQERDTRALRQELRIFLYRIKTRASLSSIISVATYSIDIRKHGTKTRY